MDRSKSRGGGTTPTCSRSSSRRLAPAVAVECVQAFLETDGVDPDEQVRIDELLALDE